MCSLPNGVKDYRCGEESVAAAVEAERAAQGEGEDTGIQEAALLEVRAPWLPSVGRGV